MRRAGLVLLWVCAAAPARADSEWAREVGAVHQAEVEQKLLPPVRNVSDDERPRLEISDSVAESRRILGGSRVISRVRVVVSERGFACPPGMDNPWWRKAYGVSSITDYVRVCDRGRGEAEPVCSDAPPKRVPRPMCPRLP